jgi:hypothetical protein
MVQITSDLHNAVRNLHLSEALPVVLAPSAAPPSFRMALTVITIKRSTDQID